MSDFHPTSSRPARGAPCHPSGLPGSGPGFVVRLLAGAALVAATLAPGLQAQERVRVEGLGTVEFSATGAPEAREAFARGLLLLHSFEYEDAADAFREARATDPEMAMAYWGEAMTHNHPVWNERDREAALAVLDRYAPTPEARQARAPTALEKGFLRAVDVLYAPGPKAQRDTAYADAMAELSEAFPDDDEARAFHALALLGLSQGDRDVPGYMRAGAIALDVFERNPDHPGAAHYVIHSFDDPVHAPLGMEAAERYAAIAPRAAHAQHMTTHIFLALGMWDGVVAANERADAVVDEGLAADGEPPTDCGHYNQWLQYGYQQQGRFADAEALLAGCRGEVVDEDLPEGRRDGAAGSYLWTRALYLVDTERMEGPHAAPVPPEVRRGRDGGLAAWADGYAASARGEVEAAEAALERLRERGPTGWGADHHPVLVATLEARVAQARGDDDAALEAAARAAEAEEALPVAFGPPLAPKPSRELQGDLLLEAGRAGEALVAYDRALERTPRRMRALLGYARAAHAAGEEAGAREAYTTLLEILHEGAEAEALVEEARAYLEATDDDGP